jgi:CBS domain-containing protein
MSMRAKPPTAADRTPVSAVMTSDVICVGPDVTIETLTALLLERGFSGVPVVDQNGHPIGVVSKTDLLRELSEDGESTVFSPLDTRAKNRMDVLGGGYHVESLTRATVGEVMMPVAFTLSEHAPIAQAAALMAFEGVHRIPVVSAEGEVVGLVSSLDILRWLAEQDGYLARKRDPSRRANLSTM